MSARAFIVGTLAISALAATVALPAEPNDADTLQHGVWRKHEHELHYVGFMSEYSCDWLDYKLRLLLKAAGARADVKITTHCIHAVGPSADATANMTFYTLAPREAAERTGAHDGGLLGASTTAVWRTVKIRDHSPIELEAMDCELVRQFRDQVLPSFTIRKMIANSIRCVPGEVSSGDIDLQFEVLAAK